MDTSRRRFIAGGIGLSVALASGGIAHAWEFTNPGGLLDHYREWLVAVEWVASEDARRVTVMREGGRRAIGRHYASIEICEAFVQADRRCDAARAHRDYIERIIAQAPVASGSDRWVKRRLADAYPT